VAQSHKSSERPKGSARPRYRSPHCAYSALSHYAQVAPTYLPGLLPSPIVPVNTAHVKPGHIIARLSSKAMSSLCFDLQLQSLSVIRVKVAQKLQLGPLQVVSEKIERNHQTCSARLSHPRDLAMTPAPPSHYAHQPLSCQQPRSSPGRHS
jgi:hypothetical protein